MPERDGAGGAGNSGPTFAARTRARTSRVDSATTFGTGRPDDIGVADAACDGATDAVGGSATAGFATVVGAGAHATRSAGQKRFIRAAYDTSAMRRRCKVALPSHVLSTMVTFSRVCSLTLLLAVPACASRGAWSPAASPSAVEPPPPPAPPSPPIDLAAVTPLDYFTGRWHCDAALPFGSPQHPVDLNVVRAPVQGDSSIQYVMTFEDPSGVYGERTEHWFGAPGSFSMSSFPSSGSTLAHGEGGAWKDDVLLLRGELQDLNVPACVGCKMSPPQKLEATFTRKGPTAFELDVLDTHGTCTKT
jgi:hypothetical protein